MGSGISNNKSIPSHNREGIFCSSLKASKLVVGKTKGFLRGKALSVEGHTHTAAQVGALPINGGISTGKTTFSKGLAVTSADQNDDMQFFLGIKSFAEGGDVQWISTAGLKSLLKLPTGGQLVFTKHTTPIAINDVINSSRTGSGGGSWSVGFSKSFECSPLYELYIANAYMQVTSSPVNGYGYLSIGSGSISFNNDTIADYNSFSSANSKVTLKSAKSYATPFTEMPFTKTTSLSFNCGADHLNSYTYTQTTVINGTLTYWTVEFVK